MSRALLFLIVLGIAIGCAPPKSVQLPPYPEFVAAREQSGGPALVEMYGRYSAGASDKTFRSSFNLLLNPGKQGYLEILGPSKQLYYAVSIDSENITALWAREQQYVREKSSPETLQKVAGLPLFADDVLMLIGGAGLNFSAWQLNQPLSDGWELRRATFTADLHMREYIVRIGIRSPNYPELIVKYDDYRTIDNRSIPGTILFEIPKRKMRLEWKIDKYLPRDQEPAPELFTVQLPQQAQRLALQDIYKGKPVLFQ